MQTRSLQVYIMVISLLIFVTPVFAMSSGLSVTPSKLVIDKELGKNSAVLFVKNISDDTSIFTVYPDDMKKIFNIHPESFVLESGQSREVSVKVHNDTASLVQTNISIVSRTVIENGLTFGSGIKIPVTIYMDEINTNLFASAFFVTPITKALLWMFGALFVLMMIVVVSRRFYR